MNTFFNVSDRYGNEEPATLADYRELNPDATFKRERSEIVEYDSTGAFVEVVARQRETETILPRKIAKIDELNGLMCRYGSNNIEVYEDVDGGYNVTYSKATSATPYHTVNVSAYDIEAHMRSLQPDLRKWRKVEFES